jgi:hypothetical protein
LGQPNRPSEELSSEGGLHPVDREEITSMSKTTDGFLDGRLPESHRQSCHVPRPAVPVSSRNKPGDPMSPNQ